MSLDIYFHEVIKCPHCGENIASNNKVFWKNITHNLGRMADAAGFYKHLWRPDEIGVKNPSQLIEPLEKGIKDMEEHPEKYEHLSASNGWGTYTQFLPWLRELLEKCREYPDAQITVSR